MRCLAQFPNHPALVSQLCLWKCPAATHAHEQFQLIREVKALAYKIRGQLPAAVANALLVENGELKLGAWCATKTKAGFS